MSPSEYMQTKEMLENSLFSPIKSLNGFSEISPFESLKERKSDLLFKVLPSTISKSPA